MHQLGSPGDRAEIIFSGGNINANTEGSVPENVGQYVDNTWYRTTLTMQVDPNNGALSTYSVSVVEIATNNNVGSRTGLNMMGTPTSIGQVMIGAINFGAADYDNISVVPEPSAALFLSTGLLLLVGRRRLLRRG